MSSFQELDAFYCYDGEIFIPYQTKEQYGEFAILTTDVYEFDNIKRFISKTCLLYRAPYRLVLEHPTPVIILDAWVAEGSYYEQTFIKVQKP